MHYLATWSSLCIAPHKIFSVVYVSISLIWSETITHWMQCTRQNNGSRYQGKEKCTNKQNNTKTMLLVWPYVVFSQMSCKLCSPVRSIGRRFFLSSNVLQTAASWQTSNKCKDEPENTFRFHRSSYHVYTRVRICLLSILPGSYCLENPASILGKRLQSSTGTVTHWWHQHGSYQTGTLTIIRLRCFSLPCWSVSTQNLVMLWLLVYDFWIAIENTQIMQLKLKCAFSRKLQCEGS